MEQNDITISARDVAMRFRLTDDKILSLIECNNEEVKQENSNKNPTVNSVQRDYMAGEISKDRGRYAEKSRQTSSGH